MRVNRGGMAADASTLRREYGPAPWWSKPKLRELLVERGLTARDVAEAFDVDRSTVKKWQRRYGL